MVVPLNPGPAFGSPFRYKWLSESVVVPLLLTSGFCCVSACPALPGAFPLVSYLFLQRMSCFLLVGTARAVFAFRLVTSWAAPTFSSPSHTSGGSSSVAPRWHYRFEGCIRLSVAPLWSAFRLYYLSLSVGRQCSVCSYWSLMCHMFPSSNTSYRGDESWRLNLKSRGPPVSSRRQTNVSSPHRSPRQGEPLVTCQLFHPCLLQPRRLDISGPMTSPHSFSEFKQFWLDFAGLLTWWSSSLWEIKLTTLLQDISRPWLMIPQGQVPISILILALSWVWSHSEPVCQL